MWPLRCAPGVGWWPLRGQQQMTSPWSEGILRGAAIRGISFITLTCRESRDVQMCRIGSIACLDPGKLFLLNLLNDLFYMSGSDENSRCRCVLHSTDKSPSWRERLKSSVSCLREGFQVFVSCSSFWLRSRWFPRVRGSLEHWFWINDSCQNDVTLLDGFIEFWNYE